MLKIELIWRELLYRAIDKRQPEFSITELAERFSLSTSVVSHALFPLRELKMVKIEKTSSQITDSEKLLFFWATRRKLEKDIIYSLAGTLSHVDSMRDPMTDLEINCRAQLSLLESVRKYNPDVRIVFAGTRNQYGKALYLPVDEKHIQEPTDINGINSIAAEKYHFLYDRCF